MKIINEIKKGAIQAITIISILGIAGFSYATWNSITQVNTGESLTATKFNELISNQADLKSRLDNLNTGKVLQVIQTTTSSSISTTGTANTNMIATITPTSTTSKILVSVDYVMGTNTSGNAMATSKLLRNGSEAFNWNQTAGNVVGSRAVTNVSKQYLDSPSTTNEITYQVQVTSVDGSTITIGNWGYGGWGSPQIITLMEIAN